MGTDGGTAGGNGGQVTPPVDPAIKAALDKAALDKARAEADEAAAAARSAVAKAANDEREAAWNGSAAATAERDAAARKAAAEADQTAVAAQRDKVASLIPDFSKIERGSLDFKGDQPLFGSALAQQALRAAAANVVNVAADALPENGNWRLLVTSDADLVTSHSTYVEVVTGLDELCASIGKLLPKPAEESKFEVAPLLPVAGAIAGAIPGLVSLFSAHRTVMTATVSGDDFAAAAAIAGLLVNLDPHGTVLHDDVRLITEVGDVHTKLRSLREKRQELGAKRIDLTTEKANATTALTVGQTRMDDAEKKLADAPTDEKLRAERDAAKLALGPLESAVESASVKLSLAESLQTGVDAFITSLTTIPQGAKRSPFEIAVARERLHDVPGAENESSFTHVLLVKGVGGGLQQAVDDKPFLMDDRYTVVATTTITYVLLQTTDSAIIAAGNAGGSAAGTGKIGDDDFHLNLQASPLVTVNSH